MDLTDSKEKLELEDESRKTLAQIIGGLFLLLGLVFTYNSYRQDADQLALSTRQLKITEEGQVTERFTKAVSLIGSQEIEVRIAGLYALERIAKDARNAYLESKEASENSKKGSSANRNTNSSPGNANNRSQANSNMDTSQNSNNDRKKDSIKDFKDNYWAIMELIASYARERSRKTFDPTKPVKKIDADIQAALTILGRRIGLDERDDEGDFIDLRDAKLHEADLSGLNFAGADFTNADLSDATMENAVLPGATFDDTVLFNAELTGARGLTIEQIKVAKRDANTKPPALPEGWEQIWPVSKTSKK